MDIRNTTDFVNANQKSDKTIHHGYQRFYPYFLEPLRSIPNIKMLELGYYKGDSIEIWQNYFVQPSIDSIDIIEDPHDTRLTKYHQVNQDKIEELDFFVKKCPSKYHFIIDDASHIPTHQWNTFIRFFSVLEDGGVYIIEDTETNFWGRSWQYGYAFNSKTFSIYNFLPIINEFINAEFIEEDLQKKYQLTDLENKTLREIEMVSLGQNCIIFTKKSSEFQAYYRDFSTYKQKHMVHVEDYQRSLPQKLVDKIVTWFRKK